MFLKTAINPPLGHFGRQFWTAPNADEPPVFLWLLWIYHATYTVRLIAYISLVVDLLGGQPRDSEPIGGCIEVILLQAGSI